MLDDDRLQRLAQATANAIAREYNARYGDRIPVPVPLTFELELVEPKYSGRARTSFIANTKGQKVIDTQVIELNMTMYRDHAREFLNIVIPHEMAHLNQHWRDQRTASQSAEHGYVWGIAMRAMSQLPVATHTFDVTKSVTAYKAHKARLKAKKKTTTTVGGTS